MSLTKSSKTVNKGMGAISGSATNPSISFEQNPTTGLFQPALNQLGFSTNGVERFRIEETGQIKAVYESTFGADFNAVLHNGYLCRAWVNFNGVDGSIRASGNITSVIKSAMGQYIINFTIPMPDANYVVCVGGPNGSSDAFSSAVRASAAWASTPNSCKYNLYRTDINALDADSSICHVAVFR